MKNLMILIFLIASICMPRIAVSQRVLLTKYEDPLSASEKADIVNSQTLQSQAAEALDAEKYDDAISLSRKAIALWPIAGLSERVIAAALTAEGKDSEATTAYAHLLTENDRDPRDMLPYALLLLKHHQWPQALEIYYRTLPYVSSIALNEHELLTENNDYSTNEPR